MYTGLGILAVVLVVFVGWHFASRRQSLPCPAWLRWMVELDNPFTRTNRSAVIIEHLDLEPGMFVLDMGCGPGRLAIPVALKIGEQGKVVAVDIQAGMLRRAEQKAAAAGVDNIEFIKADAGRGVLDESRSRTGFIGNLRGIESGRHLVDYGNYFRSSFPAAIHGAKACPANRVPRESCFRQRHCLYNAFRETRDRSGREPGCADYGQWYW